MDAGFFCVPVAETNGVAVTDTRHPDLEAALVRASSDYLAVSRQAHLFAPDAYERMEDDAWARLQEALREAADAREEELCIGSR
jgi:hypothetical protein